MAETTLFRNVRVFDGENEALSEEMDVLVRGSTIEGVGPPTATRRSTGAAACRCRARSTLTGAR